MYSALAIITIGAVATALLGFHFFAPDGGLQMFDSLPNILQPIMEENAPVILHRPFLEQEMIEAGCPVWPVWPFWHVNDEKIMEILQLLSEILGPVVGPAIPPEVEHPIPPLPIRFLQAAIGYIFPVLPYVMIGLASWLTKGRIRDKEKIKTTKAKEEYAEKIVTLEDELKQVTMDMKKINDEKDKKIVELSDSLERLKKENPRVNELESLLGHKTEEYLNIKIAHDDLSDSLEQERPKLAVLGNQFREETEKKNKEYANMEAAQEERANEIVDLEDAKMRLAQRNIGIQANESRIIREKTDLETKLESVINEMEKWKTDKTAALAQMEGQIKKLKKDKQDQQERLEEEYKQVKRLQEEKTKLLEQFDEKSRLMKQLEENYKIEQKEREEKSKQVEQKLKEEKSNQLELLEGMRKEVKQSKDDAKEQEEKAEDLEKQRKKAEEELKILQPKLQELQTANEILKELLDKSKGQEKKQREEIGDPAPVEVDGRLPSSGASTKEDIIDEVEVEGRGGGGEGGEDDDDDANADADEGPSELPDNIGSGSPTKHRRPGRRDSKRNYKYEAEKTEEEARRENGGGKKRFD